MFAAAFSSYNRIQLQRGTEVDRIDLINLCAWVRSHTVTSHVSSTCLSSGGMSDGSGPDAHPHHRGSSPRWPGADCPHCIPNRQEEEPCWVPDYLRRPSPFNGTDRLMAERRSTRTIGEWKETFLCAYPVWTFYFHTHSLWLDDKFYLI